MSASVMTNPQITLTMGCQLTSNASFPTPGVSPKHSPNFNLAVGSSAGNVQYCVEVALSITSGTPYTLSLDSPSDALGLSISPSYLVSVLVENDSVTTGQDFTIGGGTDPVMGSTIMGFAQANGGVFFQHAPGAGWQIVSSTSDILKITVAAGTSVTGKLTLFLR